MHLAFNVYLIKFSILIKVSLILYGICKFFQDCWSKQICGCMVERSELGLSHEQVHLSFLHLSNPTRLIRIWIWSKSTIWIHLTKVTWTQNVSNLKVNLSNPNLKPIRNNLRILKLKLMYLDYKKPNGRHEFTIFTIFTPRSHAEKGHTVDKDVE